MRGHLMRVLYACVCARVCIFVSKMRPIECAVPDPKCKVCLRASNLRFFRPTPLYCLLCCCVFCEYDKGECGRPHHQSCSSLCPALPATLTRTHIDDQCYNTVRWREAYGSCKSFGNFRCTRITSRNSVRPSAGCRVLYVVGCVGLCPNLWSEDLRGYVFMVVSSVSSLCDLKSANICNVFLRHWECLTERKFSIILFEVRHFLKNMTCTAACYFLIVSSRHHISYTRRLIYARQRPPS